MKISELGLSVIKHYESLHDGDLTVIGLQPKLCPAGIWTIGWGRALRNSNGEFLRAKDYTEAYSQYPSLTIEQANEMLVDDTNDYGERVGSLDVDFKQNEFDALVSFSYNVGFEALKNSLLLKYIKQRSKPDVIMSRFMAWNKATVKGAKIPLAGLTKRRRTEGLLFTTGRVDIII